MLTTIVTAAVAGGIAALAAIVWIVPSDSSLPKTTIATESLTGSAENQEPAKLSTAGTMDDLRQRVTELEQALAAEQQGRLMLQRELTTQQESLISLRAATDLSAATAAAASAAQSTDGVHQSAEAGVAAGVAAGVVAARQSRSFRNSAENRREALIEAGIDSERAADITRRQDAVSLARLELRDQAAREGWLNASDADERISEALADQQLEQVNLRSELSAEEWDRYLYESGRPNRVVVASVLAGSVAADVQIEAGDQLLTYAGKRMHRRRDLQRATQSGQRGESVVLTIGRDGIELELVVPRGPLGVTLAPLRFDPDKNS